MSIRSSLLADAEALRKQFAKTDDPKERRTLKREYNRLSLMLEKLPPDPDPSLAASPESDEKKRHVMNWKDKELREKVGDTPETMGERREKRLEKIEKGRKQLREKQRAGVRDVAFGRIKQELDYLLKNYDPKNDAKIDTLIDKWRTSGDPSYDPAIRLKVRNVRKKKSQSDYAF